MRRLALLLCLLTQACLAHAVAGIGSEKGGVESREVPPAESDALWQCDGRPCAAVTLERPWRAGRSRALFWTTWAAEVAAGIAGGAIFMSSFASGQPSTGTWVTGVALFDTGFSLAIIDLIAFWRADDYGRQQDPPRLAKRVMADWRGVKVPLAVGDVMPAGALRFPESFSVAMAARGMGAQPAAPETARGKVAVLDLKSSASGLSSEQVRYFGDLVRGATLRAAPQLAVMTRENLLVLLQASGKDLADCEGECEVDTGRRVGADQVVSGDVLRLGTRYKLTLRLHEP